MKNSILCCITYTDYDFHYCKIHEINFNFTYCFIYNENLLIKYSVLSHQYLIEFNKQRFYIKIDNNLKPSIQEAYGIFTKYKENIEFF